MAPTTPLLPARFADLERFAERWSCGDINERYRRREASTMAELTEFYEAVVPRGEEILGYLQGFSMDDLPDAECNLMWLMASLSAVSFAVARLPAASVTDAVTDSGPSLRLERSTVVL